MHLLPSQVFESLQGNSTAAQINPAAVATLQKAGDFYVDFRKRDKNPSAALIDFKVCLNDSGRSWWWLAGKGDWE
jgi:hypothetical protein